MRRGFTFLLLLVFTCLAFGQQNRQFTLDELIPGGKNYARYVPLDSGAVSMAWR